VSWVNVCSNYWAYPDADTDTISDSRKDGFLKKKMTSPNNTLCVINMALPDTHARASPAQYLSKMVPDAAH
jgi:hypothetical protein